MSTSTRTSKTGRLLERDDQLALLVGLLRAVQADGRGRLALVSGEAGIGKSSLVRRFADDARPLARVLWGGCDALHTPRALGPFVDLAEQTGGELAEAVGREAAAPGAVVAALAQELRRRPSVVVLEDLHWADEATLDVLALVAGRVDTIPALLIATYRDDELHGNHPFRLALGDLPVRSIDRVPLAALSVDAVAELAGAIPDEGEVDAEELHRRTAGNPFFVTEVLAAGPADLPDTVRDAVLARAARLGPAARAVLDAVAIEPGRMELWLVETLAPDDAEALDRCLTAGMLLAERHTVGFRHEIARAAIEESLPPRRRLILHRRALGALTGGGHAARADVARLAHHAEAADVAEAVQEFAPAAAERAAALGSHREAAAQFARALRYARDLPRARRAALLERRSYECYLTDDIADAFAARHVAMEEHRGAGDRVREGDAHRWLSRLAWFLGDNATAEDEARIAVDLLEPRGRGPELAMAYSNMAQLRMLTNDDDGAVAWGMRAIALAEQLDKPEILAHALNNVGMAELRGDRSAAGREKLARSLALALAGGFEEHVARAYTNLGSAAVEAREAAAAQRDLDAGIVYCAEHDLDAWRLYMIGYRARAELDAGCWDAAALSATSVLAHHRVPTPSRISPLVVLGRLRARRGDPDPWAPLDEALTLARGTGELQRLGPVASARAEACWLAGEEERIAEETEATLALALARGEPWTAGELAVWRGRAGLPVDDVPRAALAEPWRLELDGAAAVAGERWAALGCPFEAALAFAQDDAEDAQRRALAELQRLGARPAAQRVARALRERGARDLRQGPRAATRANPGGLTAREVEVVALVADGLRNAEIAARLFMSERTVAHHVSAILRKLGASTRSQAAAEAARLGIVER
jgi:DNA-binding CsgD family transcriptional regulator